MQDNKNGKSKKQGKQKATVSDFQTFPHAGGNKTADGNITIPTRDGVEALKSFVEKNKK